MSKDRKDQINQYDRLAELHPSEIAELFRDEHSQVWACILLQLPPAVAGNVMECLTNGQRTDIALRMTTMDFVDTKWLKVLSLVIGKRLDQRGKERMIPIDQTASQVVASMSDEFIDQVLMNITEYDPLLGQRVEMEAFGEEQYVLRTLKK